MVVFCLKVMPVAKRKYLEFLKSNKQAGAPQPNMHLVNQIGILLTYVYRRFLKSVRHLKNSQQIKYSTDHGSSYADRERNSPSFFKHISQMLNVSTFGNTTDIYAIVHLVPHACQHITVDQSHSSGDTVAKILEISGEWRHKDSVLHKPQ